MPLWQRGSLLSKASTGSLNIWKNANIVYDIPSNRFWFSHIFFWFLEFKCVFLFPFTPKQTGEGVNGLFLYGAFITKWHPKHSPIPTHIHPCKATAVSSRAVSIRCLAKGHLDTRKSRVQTSKRLVTSTRLYLLSNVPR